MLPEREFVYEGFGSYGTVIDTHRMAIDGGYRSFITYKGLASARYARPTRDGQRVGLRAFV